MKLRLVTDMADHNAGIPSGQDLWINCGDSIAQIFLSAVTYLKVIYQ